MGQCAPSSRNFCDVPWTEFHGEIVSRCKDSRWEKMHAPIDDGLEAHPHSSMGSGIESHIIHFVTGEGILSDANGVVPQDVQHDFPVTKQPVIADAGDSSRGADELASVTMSCPIDLSTTGRHEHDSIGVGKFDLSVARIVDDEGQKLEATACTDQVRCQVNSESQACLGFEAEHGHATVSKPSCPNCQQVTCWSGCLEKPARFARSSGQVVAALVEVLLMAFQEAVTGEEHIEVTLARGRMSQNQSQKSLASIPEEGEEEGDDVTEVGAMIVEIPKGLSMSTVSTEAAMSELPMEEEAEEDQKFGGWTGE